MGQTRQGVGGMGRAVRQTRQRVGGMGRTVGQTRQRVGGMGRAVGQTRQQVGGMGQRAGQTGKGWAGYWMRHSSLSSTSCPRPPGLCPAAVRGPDAGGGEGSHSEWGPEGQSQPGQSCLPQGGRLPPGRPSVCSGCCSGQTALRQVCFFLSLSLSLITVIMSVSLQDPLSTLLSCPPPPPPPLLSVICGILKDRSVVLVTHQLQFAQLADNILAIKDVIVGRQFCSSHWGLCVEEGAKF